MKKYLVFIAATARLIASCNQKNGSPAETPAGNPGNTTLRFNFESAGGTKDIAWQIDGTPLSAGNRGAAKIRRGAHKLKVTAKGQSGEFNLDAASDVPLFVEFTAVNGTIKPLWALEGRPEAKLIVKSSPSGASLFINRRPVGNTPVAVDLLAIGQDLEIILTSPGYKMAQKTVNISQKVNKAHVTLTPLAEGESVLDSALEKPLTTLSIDAPDSPGSKIYLNGIDIHRVTPQKDLKLPIGLYNVTLERADGVKFTFKTELLAEKPAVVSENIKDREPPTGPVPGLLVPSEITEPSGDGASEEGEEHHHHGHHHHHGSAHGH